MGISGIENLYPEPCGEPTYSAPTLTSDEAVREVRSKTKRPIEDVGSGDILADKLRKAHYLTLAAIVERQKEEDR